MKTVLIVEDELILAMINSHVVESLGFYVGQVVTNGNDAIKFVQNNQPDVILMDIMIEGEMDGIETMQEIRKFSKVPVIYITGNSDPKAYSHAKSTDYAAFLTKPVDQDTLKEALDSLNLSN